MKKRQLGANGPMVSQIGLGCMSFAGFFGRADDDVSMECMQAAVDAGIDFFDTANIYGMGRSEHIVGRFLRETGAQISLATKVGIVAGPPRSFSNQADYIRAELESSLERLNRDRVELYYIHRREAERPVEEVAETMGRLIDEGLIGGWGLSEVAPGTVRRAHKVTPLTAVQNEYSLWTRVPEMGLTETCAELGIAFVAFSPLARGMFGERSITPEQIAEKDFRHSNPRFQRPNWDYNAKAIEGFRRFCHGKGWSTSAGALAWVLDQGENHIPIPGTRTAAHLLEWLQADQITLSDDDRAEIARLLPKGFAHGGRYSYAQSIGIEQFG
ncbi:aldo/keto reductase [Actibacterium sp. XHP0104]|uniref:aldo/keto reductase n=1 Tax=Actibacterium sp. XHP0104 TaxID=2984335 RepID=UPI0021E93DCE|nr:aldo/keto reductase [Actibacterium sp. XHP0104]MCV2882648.1 aldo/keto reductase [Actibacterium sp. XHP0104]